MDINVLNLKNMEVILMIFLSFGYEICFGKEGGPDNRGQSEVDSANIKGPGVNLSVAKINTLGISTYKASGGTVDLVLVLFGKIELHPERTHHYHSRTEGVVMDVLKTTGDQVRVGDVLVRIEPNFGLQNTEIVSSMAGIVLDKKVSQGQIIDEEIKALTVGDMTQVLATFLAYPRDLAKIATGQKISVLTTQGEHPQESTLSFISPVLDPSTRTARLQANLRNNQGLWRPGQFVIGKVKTGAVHVAVRVSNDIVGEVEEGVGTLLVKQGDHFTMKEVAIGKRDSAFSEVLSGLAEGEEYLGVSHSALETMLKREGADATSESE